MARGTFLAMPDLERVPEDWERGLAVVAHPDDMEYGAAAAVARWTGQGKWIGYVLVTDGEAGIASMPPEQAGPIRREEQIASCREVGVTDVEFLGLPDGVVVEGLELRARPGGGDPSAPTGRGRCRSTTATRGAGRAGTTPTTEPSVGPCSTRSATPPTPGCSAIGATHGMASASPPSTAARRRPTVSTSPPRSTPVSGRSPATAPTSRTSAATWPHPTSSSVARADVLRRAPRRGAGGHLRADRLTPPIEYGPVCDTPVDRAAMVHWWDELTFLHWRFEPAAVQRLLPAGLTVETMDGSAWVGLVPFFLRVGLPGVPSVPWLSRFAETNVRTYVRSADGARGIWFFSLDAARLGAVVTARATYRIPYFWSRMSIERAGSTISYRCRRRWPGPRGARATSSSRSASRFAPDELTELDHFLTARWSLFSAPRSGLHHALASHDPWPLHRARVVDVRDELILAAGLPAPTASRSSTTRRRVEVRIGWPSPVDID